MIVIQKIFFSVRVFLAFLFILSCGFSLADGTPSAFALFKDQAELGDVEAQFNLGVMCETGWSVPVDNKKAVRWFRAAAKQGHAKAQLRLGMMYYLGIGSPQSNIKGEKWIRKAAKQGQPLAERLHDALFAAEVPDSLSPSSVLSQVRETYLKDERQAESVLNSLLHRAKQKEQRAEKAKETTTIRERRAKRGVEGPVKPGFSVEQNVERVESAVPGFIGDASVEENRTLARGSIATIRLQAEEGLASAQHNLGRMYELGIKIPTDKTRALKWYKKAAKQGYADAEYRLGIMFLYGAGARRDEAAGKKWLALAASHDHPVAKSMITELEAGTGALANGISLAVRWYLERALKGDNQAAFHLGKIYEHGWGIRSDLAEAMKWYQRANQAGINGAQAAVDALKSKLNKLEEEEKPGVAEEFLQSYGLPVWLTHPAVIISVVLVILMPLFFLRRRRPQNKRLRLDRESSDVQEV